jgi:hypothetical protein
LTDPDTQTQPDEHEDATNQGISATEPAEGSDDAAARDEGSPAPE